MFVVVLAFVLPVQAGLNVVVGEESVEKLRGRYTGEGSLVHGLVTSPSKAAAMRAELEEMGLLGELNVSSYDGKNLPFIENTVNKVEIRDSGSEIQDREIERVLAPGGAAVVGGNRAVKAVPGDTDEWPQYLHDSCNNAVAHDKKVGPPKHLQWRAGPRWSRHHDHMSSVSACVSANGRVFSIIDEGSVSSILLPSKWKLIARDAYNGLRLWDRDIATWYTRAFALKSGPSTLPRRLATDGDFVYAMLGSDDPVSIIDAVTGKTIRELATDEHPREILLVENMVLVVTRSEPIGDTSAFLKAQGESAVYAFNKKSGKRLWKVETPIIRLTLAADAKRVYFASETEVVALKRMTGERLWGCPRGTAGKIISEDAPTLVVHGDTVLMADPKKGEKKLAGLKKKGAQGARLTAIGAVTGRKLWEGTQPPSGYRSPGDILVIDGLAWNGPVTSGGMEGTQTGRNLRTGKPERAWPPTVETYWFHHRCYRAKATDDYIMLSRTGIEYVDIDTGNWDINHYVRGACLYGVMPANGLTYAPPHPCSCYPETKLDGFVALAAANNMGAKIPAPGESAGRLEKGEAYGLMADHGTRAAFSSDWPTFRYANNRCGYSTADAGDKLDASWSTDLGTLATQPIVVGNRLYVSTPETHSIHALDSKTGKVAWTFAAGGRSDTPPTWHRGRLLFGATDGYVYSVNATDGRLVWRFRAAPLDRRQVHFERVESVWPVNGNILVNDADEAVFVAGRSVFLDDGLRFIRLNAMTGELVHESALDRIDDRTGEDLHGGVQRLNMPVGLPDLLGSDGERYFMRSEVLDANGKRLGQAPHSTMPSKVIVERPIEDAHLYAPSGFADSDWWHRTYWNYGSVSTGGHDGYYQAGRFTPSGRILVHDEDNVFGYCRKDKYYKWISTLQYHMFSAPRGQQFGPEQQENMKHGGSNQVKQKNFVTRNWAGEISIQLRAMAGAGKNLIIAGPPNELVEPDVARPQVGTIINDPEWMKKINAQQKAEDGELGGKIIVINPASGERVKSVDLDSPPVFDGMIVANGCVYLSALDGTVRCFGGE